VTSLTTPTGSVAATYTYDSFGFMTNSTGSATNWFRYTARQFDSDTGLYYYRARYYDPQSGRFLSEDPIRFNGGPDFYLYGGNNSANFTDPFGNKSLIDRALNYISPLPPPPPALSNIGLPVSPPILYTDMNHGQAGGTTTFYPGNSDPAFSIPTLTLPDSKSKPGAGDPYCSTVVGVLYTGGGDPRDGMNGSCINTGDTRGRVIHGGGASLADPFDPNQPLTPTRGCTRGHNQDVVDLGGAITQYQQSNPGMPITYCRK
jgi:RHS repeat-associated protein